MIDHTGFDKLQVKEVGLGLLAAKSAFETTSLKVVIKKFRSVKYFEVAKKGVLNTESQY